MGVKAVVEAIVEPDQEGEVDGLGTDAPWADEERIAQLASLVKKGLQVVGVVYTDLTPCVPFYITSLGVLLTLSCSR